MKKSSGAWRMGLSDLLIAAGMLVLWTGALFWTRTALAAGQVSAYRYLPAASRLALPLPALAPAGGPLRLAFSPAPETSAELPPVTGITPAAGAADPGAAAPPSTLAAAEAPGAGNAPAAGIADPAATPPSSMAATEALAATEAMAAAEPPATERPRLIEPTPLASPTPAAQPAEPTPAPTAEPTLPPYSPVIRIVIPALDIDRAVVPVGMRPDSSGALTWDTDPLFSTRNRPDLVGQLVGSASPGQGGNILLIGHNYNQVDYGWTGVFVNIKNLKAGDLIGVFTEDGRQVNYAVKLVKQVPWRSQSPEELEKHMKFMGPSAGEQLTLVTCGGANIWPFPARVYVVAVPAP